MGLDGLVHSEHFLVQDTVLTAMLIIALLYLLLPLLSLAHFNMKPNYLAAPIEHGKTVMLVATLALGAFALAQLVLLGAVDAANTGVRPSSGSRYVAICNVLLLLGTFSLIINRWLECERQQSGNGSSSNAALRQVPAYWTVCNPQTGTKSIVGQ